MTRASLIVAEDPFVFTREDLVCADSRGVAKRFKKIHRDVVRAIENLIQKRPELGVRHFVQTSFVDAKNGRTYVQYDMDRRAFTLLVMGFTGKDAIDWKLRYIDAFETMEDALRTPLVPAFSLDDPAFLRTALLGYTEKVIALEAKVAVAQETIALAAPKAEFFDSFIDADGLYGLQNAARVLDEAPNRFCAWLEVERILFRQGRTLVPRAQYLKMGIFAVKAIVIDEVARQRTYVTPKGLQYLCRRLGKAPDLFGKLR